MSKKCARCEKTVYPTEELKCLDKIWHKPCFKCKECGMALNMRNYKGFNKEPYCEAHIPKAKATTIADTLELKRIAENTKIQSNVKYHADFEKSKGKFTQLADDPEILRIKQNTKIISNVAYHGELERKAEMEQRRQLNENGYSGNGNMTSSTTISNSINHNVTTTVNPSKMTNNNISSTSANVTQSVSSHHHHHQHQHHNQSMPQHHQIRNSNSNNANVNVNVNTARQTAVNYNNHYQQQRPQQQYQQPQQVAPPSSAYPARNSQTLIYSSDGGGRVENPAQRQIGSVHDMDPINHNYGSLGRVYRAMYDYAAQDLDEVSFVNGDLIVDVSSIDSGWMTGRVQRTGKVGMLPANYVQLVNI